MSSRTLRLALVLVALLVACDREQARVQEREQRHAQRLEQEMAKLHAEIAAWKAPEPGGGQNFDKVIPEWKSYGEGLAKCRQQLDQVLAKMAAKQYADVAPLAEAGFRTARDLETTVTAKSPDVVEARARAAGALFPEFFSASLTYLQAAAVLYQGQFHQPLAALSLHAPRAERLATVERFVSLHQEAKTPGLAQALGHSLQKAWAEEDDPGNKAQIEQRLKQLNLPLTPPPATPAPAAKSK